MLFKKNIETIDSLFVPYNKGFQRWSFGRKFTLMFECATFLLSIELREKI